MKCDKLNTTANVIMSGCGSASNSYGDKCLFYCEHGYKAVSGTKERRCQENGTWSGSPLTCAGKLLRHCFSRTDFKMIDQDPEPGPDQIKASWRSNFTTSMSRAELFSLLSGFIPAEQI